MAERILTPLIFFFFLSFIVLPSFFEPCIVQGQNIKADSVIYYSHSQLDTSLRSTASPDRISRLLGKSKGNAPYLVIIRTKPGDVEIHEQWDDVAIIRSGSGILKSGRQAKGQKQSGSQPSREWIGGVIQNPIERKLTPGDFIIIPAMIAHQYIPSPGDTLTYWTIKVNGSKNSNP